jgi:hypothetical protein
MPTQTLPIIVLGTVAVALACIAVLKLNEKNMQEIEANQNEIDKLADRINELARSQNANNETKTDSKD